MMPVFCFTSLAWQALSNTLAVLTVSIFLAIASIDYSVRPRLWSQINLLWDFAPSGHFSVLNPLSLERTSLKIPLSLSYCIDNDAVTDKSSDLTPYAGLQRPPPPSPSAKTFWSNEKSKRQLMGPSPKAASLLSVVDNALVLKMLLLLLHVAVTAALVGVRGRGSR